VQFSLDEENKQRLADLPWHVQLEEWEAQGVQLLIVRRGDSRHPVIFVERQGVRYAIKETTPRMAEREIRNLQEIERRGIPSLIAVGTVHVTVPPIAIEVPGVRGMREYINADRGYTVTRLAPRVVPQVLLYRLPLTRRIKQRLLSAVALLMVQLHEEGVYWGDPSLANALIRIDGNHILSIMADAETVELFPKNLSEGLREQDLAQFGDSLAWQAEDLRQAKGLPDDAQVLDDSDYRYFRRRYNIFRRERDRAAGNYTPDTGDFSQGFLQTLNEWGSTLTEKAETTVRSIIPTFPGWYQRRIYEILHVTIPRQHARRFYHLIIGHQAIMSKNEERDVNLEEAAHDFYEQYHLPTILLLRQHLSNEQDPMQAYFEIMDHKWTMSMKAGHEIPIEEAITDLSQQSVSTKKKRWLDLAKLSTSSWQQQTLHFADEQPSLIESEELDPLLSTAERPLIRLKLEDLQRKLPEILARSIDEANEGKEED
jgi:Domain of unknown function (DUF4032)